MTVLEWTAALLGLAGVLLGLQQRSGVWILWVFSSGIYCLIYLSVALYGQALLMVAFIGMSLWGLLAWRTPSDRAADGQHAPQVRSIARAEVLSLAGLMLAGWLALGLWLAQTDSTSPWLDALVTAVSLVAMRLMARRLRACWLAWAVANGLSVWLFVSQALWATALLYGLQLALSFVGYWRWPAPTEPHDQSL